MKLADKLRIIPFCRILPPYAAGILSHGYVRAPAWAVIAVAVAVYLAAWHLRTRKTGRWYLFAALFCTGIVTAMWHATRETVPRNEPVTVVVETTEDSFVRGRWQHLTARTGPFRTHRGANGEWTEARERIGLCIDTAHPVRRGQRLIVHGRLRPLDTTGSRYGTLMRSRGISARLYVTAANPPLPLGAPDRRVAEAAAAFRAGAVERMGRLPVQEPERSVLLAMTTGERRGLDRTLRAAYARAGVSHILAISGLHMGFVLLFAHLLLGWLVWFRHGHIVKNTLCVVLLWTYALAAGLSPPVVRSALMLSAAQIALGASVRGNGYNIVLGTATLMLAVRPFGLFDVSFQLSFAAVLSILFFYPRLYRRRLSRNRIADTLWSSLLVGAAAQIGTLPLVAYHFGNIPLLALPINPVVVLTAFAAVCAGLVWLLCPIAPIGTACGAAAEYALKAQTALVERIASLPFAAVTDIRIDGLFVCGVYLLLAAAALALKFREEIRTGETGGIPSHRVAD